MINLLQCLTQENIPVLGSASF